MVVEHLHTGPNGDLDDVEAFLFQQTKNGDENSPSLDFRDLQLAKATFVYKATANSKRRLRGAEEEIDPGGEQSPRATNEIEARADLTDVHQRLNNMEAGFSKDSQAQQQQLMKERDDLTKHVDNLRQHDHYELLKQMVQVGPAGTSFLDSVARRKRTVDSPDPWTFRKRRRAHYFFRET